MAAAQPHSDSLISSLCREMASLRDRWRRVNHDLGCCRDSGLRDRLLRELAGIEGRRVEIRASIRILEAGPWRRSLSLALLRELALRPLPEPIAAR